MFDAGNNNAARASSNTSGYNMMQFGTQAPPRTEGHPPRLPPAAPAAAHQLPQYRRTSRSQLASFKAEEEPPMSQQDMQYASEMAAKVRDLRKHHTHMLNQIAEAAKTLGQVAGHNQALRSELVLLKNGHPDQPCS